MNIVTFLGVLIDLLLAFMKDHKRLSKATMISSDNKGLYWAIRSLRAVT